MAAKEPTVERKRFGECPGDMEAIALVNSFKAKGEGELYVTDIQLIAKALRATAERARDEGYVTGREHALAVSLLMDLGKAPPSPPVNPYRLPPKGDGNGE